MKSTCMRCGDGTLLEQFSIQLAEVTEERDRLREALKAASHAKMTANSTLSAHPEQGPLAPADRVLLAFPGRDKADAMSHEPLTDAELAELERKYGDAKGIYAIDIMTKKCQMRISTMHEAIPRLLATIRDARIAALEGKSSGESETSECQDPNCLGAEATPSASPEVAARGGQR